MINTTVNFIRSCLLKTLQLLIFSLLFLQITMGPITMGPITMDSAIAQSQRPQTASTAPSSLERPTTGGTDTDKSPISQPAQEGTPKNTSDTPSNKPKATRSEEDDSKAFQGNRPADPYAPHYDSMKKFNEEVYGERG
jgi:hypothetical protein